MVGRYRKYFYWSNGSYIMELGDFLDDLFYNKRKNAALEKIEDLKDLYV